MQPAPIQAVRAQEALLRGHDAVQRTQNYPLYLWPMEDALHDSVHIVGYVDEDASAGILDYMNGDWTYDTHRGTDFALTDFRAMDRGMRIRSAAPGTVTYTVYANRRDRNCDLPDNPTLNYIEIANGDGTYTYYYHLRSNSMTVNAGEAVQAGEVLGLAGSSGYSYGAHLHFEPADYSAGYVRRDPWAGPANPLPGLWLQQAPWEGTQHLRIYDLGVTTQTAAGGNLGNIAYCRYVAEHLQQPAVLGIHEPFFPIWFYPQALAGDSYRVEIRKPDHSLWSFLDDTFPGDFHFGYYYWYWNWDGYVSSADYGSWTVSILVGGQPVRQVSFVVGASTVFGPRFKPAVARSFRIDGTVQRDTLRVTSLGGPVTYSLLNAPAFVTLTDSVLSVAATSTQTTRSRYFQAIATDGAARRDTAFFHVVDPSKPQEPVLDAGTAPLAATLGLSPGQPNPFSERTTIRFALPHPAHVTLAIIDLSGRRVRTLVDGDRAAWAGGETVTWDGRDEHGQLAPAGIYFCRLSSDHEHITRRLVRLP